MNDSPVKGPEIYKNELFIVFPFGIYAKSPLIYFEYFLQMLYE
jgi:hypothetical protein